jgi:hypothetical protein
VRLNLICYKCAALTLEQSRWSLWDSPDSQRVEQVGQSMTFECCAGTDLTVFLVLTSNNVSAHYRRASAIAIGFIMTNSVRISRSLASTNVLRLMFGADRAAFARVSLFPLRESLQLTVSGIAVSTWLFDDAPRFHKGTVTNLIFSIGIAVFAIQNIWYLTVRNKRKAAAKAQESAGTVKPSSETSMPLDDRDARFEYTL